MFSAAHIFRMNHVSIALLGNQKPFSLDTHHAREAAQKMGAQHNRICVIHVPSNEHGPGHRTIHNANFEAPVYGDGALAVVRRSALAWQTADCASVILVDGKSGNLVGVHAGRPGMTPPVECATCSFSVLDAAFGRLVQTGAEPQHVTAFIVGSICGNCFVHDNPGAEEYVTPFDRYGEDIFADRSRGALDMVKLITKLLVHKGVLLEHIHHDKVCTKENANLASKRAGRYDTRNTIIAVRH